MRSDLSLFALNRGIVSPLGLARQDIKRVAMGAETQTNWVPRVLGSMMLRPGFKYIGATASNLISKFVKFIFSTTDTALLEMTTGLMRVWINDALLTRPSVTTAISNTTFATGPLTGWTDLDEAGAASSYSSGLVLVGTGTTFAMREQQVTVAGANIGVEHGIRIVVSTGPVVVRIGSTTGADDYLSETTLETGTHSLSITPTGDFFLRFKSRLLRQIVVVSASVEAAGVVSLPTPWPEADLGNIRYDQSGDTVYAACEGYQQRVIERRGTRPNARSWSVALYRSEDGPFKVLNVTPTTIAPSALTGNITLTASTPTFKSTSVGALYSLTSAGQSVSTAAAASATATSSIRVTGVSPDRTFSITITGNNTASTVDIQRSYDNSTWTNAATLNYTTDVTTTYADGLDNQIVYYRAILTTRVAPDVVTMALRIGAGSVRGIARVTGYTSELIASAEVLSDMGGTAATADWQEGQWSDRRGWPTAVKIHEGRMWWTGLNGIWGSISDRFDSFDEYFSGDAGPINRTIGSGPVDTINWLLSLKGLMVGAQGTEYSIRASSLDEPLTPTNFNVKPSSTQGSGSVDAVKVDQSGVFVNRSGVRVFDLSFDLKGYDFSSSDLMMLAPDIGRPGITRMDVQRLPDTRIHCVRSDGTVAMSVMNKGEEVLAWIEIETDGLIEDVVTLPAEDGNTDDQVYYQIKRTINGSTVRYLEKWAQERECIGGTLSRCADSYVTYTGSAATVITGLSHLEGEQVVVWADGADVGTIDTARPWTQTYTVSGGQIVLATAATNVVVGLGYTAQFKSTKLGLTGPGVVPLNKTKNGRHMGLILANTHHKGIKYGPTLDDTGSLLMDDMPGIENGASVGDGVYTTYDEQVIEFPGLWTTDMRLCLQAQAPRPATVMAIALEMEQS